MCLDGIVMETALKVSECLLSVSASTWSPAEQQGAPHLLTSPHSLRPEDVKD